MKVIKRDGREVDFEISKIINAVSKANKEVEDIHQLSDVQIKAVADDIADSIEASNHAANVEDIQDLVETGIMKMRGYEVARKYVKYRYKHELARKNKGLYNNILSIVNRSNESIIQENSNKNPIINSTQRDYIAGEVSKAITDDMLLPPDIAQAHNDGLLHFHDKDYFVQPMHNCCVFNLDDMLQNGTVISNTMIEKPKSLQTASTITSQVIAQIASNQYGGMTFSLLALAKFVDVSRQKHREQTRANLEAILPKESITDEMVNTIAERDLRLEIKSSMQTLQYQIITLLTVNGQAPFITIWMYIDEAEDECLKRDLVTLIEEILKQRILGIKNESGAYVSQAFPKLIYVLQENNIHSDSEYFWLTQLAAKCTAKRLVPDYVSEKIMLGAKHAMYPIMGCRSCPTPDRFSKTYGNMGNIGNFDSSKPQAYSRFNQGVVTINLPDVALSSKGNMEKFWELMDERCELCHKALRLRHERLLGTPTTVAPILWMHGGIARLKADETIDKLLYHGYSTISLGYIGLYETVKYLTGKSHTQSDEGKKLGLEIMQFMNDKCRQWRDAEDIDYSLYGAPAESLCYRFAQCLQKRFGIIEGITDHNYITNSYHCCVREEINAFDKLNVESQYQLLSPGGAISYIEVPDMQQNIPAVISVIQYIYEHIMYAELNTKSDYCSKCGFDGEIKIVEDEHGKLQWECPNCGCRDHNLLHVTRRTCGYIGTQFWNEGKTQEIRERVLHL